MTVSELPPIEELDLTQPEKPMGTEGEQHLEAPNPNESRAVNEWVLNLKPYADRPALTELFDAWGMNKSIVAILLMAGRELVIAKLTSMEVSQATALFDSDMQKLNQAFDQDFKQEVYDKILSLVAEASAREANI